MDPTKTHSKFWRPNILLIIDNPATGLIGFCNMLKRGGVLMLGMALPGSLDVFAEFVKPLRLAWVASRSQSSTASMRRWGRRAGQRLIFLTTCTP